ncbi:MAG: hypothetical protein ABSB18_02780 [Candidatus Omnitrophota bacterium]
MPNILNNRHRLYQTKFSFGATSGIITNLGLITALDTMAHPRLSIIAGILVIALADNIADSLGIHIYQESEGLNEKEVWFSTLTNFLARILVSLTFILLVVTLPINLAVYCSVTWGLVLLAILSYTIAKAKGVNPFRTISEHIAIAIAVITASHFIGKWIIGRF